jgi:hypothetical protein
VVKKKRSPPKKLDARQVAGRLSKALNIIKPKERDEACQLRVVAAVRVIAAVAMVTKKQQKVIATQMLNMERKLAKFSEPLASTQRQLRARVEALDGDASSYSDLPPGAELSRRRRRRRTIPTAARRRMTAVVLAADLMDDFADPAVENLPGSKVTSPHAALAQCLYEAATGAELPIHGLKHQVAEYYREMASRSRDDVRAERERNQLEFDEQVATLTEYERNQLDAILGEKQK